MKKIIVPALFVFFAAASFIPPAHTSPSARKETFLHWTGTTPGQKDTIPAPGEALKNPALLQGIWAAVGEENATFVISWQTISIGSIDLRSNLVRPR